MSQVAFLVLMAAVVGGIYLVNREMYRRRRDALAAYASTHGLTFIEDQPGKAKLVTDLVPALNTGSAQDCRFELRGTRGDTQYSAFEYTYVTGSGRYRQYHSCAMLLWRREADNWPAFTLVPEGWWEKIKQRFRTEDLDFPEDPAFSKVYQLTGPDAQAVRNVFNASRRAFVTEQAGIHLVGNGPYLLWWTPASFPPAQNLDSFFADGEAIRRVFQP